MTTLAEKLRVLDVPSATNDPFWMQEVQSDWIIDVILALPQLVAVVGAAERIPELRYSNDQPSLSASWSAKDLRAALAALEDALGT